MVGSELCFRGIKGRGKDVKNKSYGGPLTAWVPFLVGGWAVLWCRCSDGRSDAELLFCGENVNEFTETFMPIRICKRIDIDIYVKVCSSGKNRKNSQ